MVWKLKGLFSRKRAFIQPSGAEWFQRGTEHASRKEWQLALECFRETVRVDPRHAEAQAFSGNVLRLLGKLDAAIAAYDSAIAAKPDYAEVHYNRGTLLKQLSQTPAALQSFESALKVNPSFAQAHSRRGDMLREMGQSEAADAAYRRAIALMPADVDAYFYLGVLQSKNENHAEALQCFNAAIAVRPAHAGAHAGRGLSLMASNQPREALEAFETACRLEPDFARVFSNRAQAQAEIGLLSEARASHDQAGILDPMDAEIHFNRGVFLYDRKEWSEAAGSYRRAIVLRPDYAEAHCNFGLAQQQIGNVDMALESYMRALICDPRLVAALNNRGNLFRSRKQFAEALRDYRAAIELESGSADAHYNIGQLALLQGDFATGWQEYEWRSQIEEAKSVPARRFSQPTWTGDCSLEGKSIFVYAEQGLGDTIQFCRYASLIAASGAQVTLEVQPALGDLLVKLHGVLDVIPVGSAIPATDYQCSLMSLPLAFQTNLDTIPRNVPYLHADPRRVERYEEIMGRRTRLRVGLVWSGNPLHSNDHNRSIPLSQLVTCLPSQFEYYCLQNEIRDADREVLQSSASTTILTPPIETFADTAALTQMLDLVLSVDTSVAHLSGAMGKETWILLPYYPDWRWLLDRTDSPWYPTVRLYRQPAPSDWNGVMSEVNAGLLRWDSEHRDKLPEKFDERPKAW